MTRERILGSLSVVGGILGLLLALIFTTNEFDYPGTEAYRTYEMLNRLIALPLGLMSCGWLGLALITAKGPEKIASWLALVASIVMAAGTAAEFWFFSDQPYGIWTNGRMASFMSFFVASLILYGCATLIGLRLLRSGANPRLGPIALAAAIPLFFANVIWLNVNFLIPALLAVVVGSMLYIPGNSDRVSQRNPVSTDG